MTRRKRGFPLFEPSSQAEPRDSIFMLIHGRVCQSPYQRLSPDNDAVRSTFKHRVRRGGDRRRGVGISVEMRPSIAISIRARKGIDHDRARQLAQRERATLIAPNDREDERDGD